MPATLIGLGPSMPYKKHQNALPSKGQFHGVIENLLVAFALAFQNNVVHAGKIPSEQPRQGRVNLNSSVEHICEEQPLEVLPGQCGDWCDLDVFDSVALGIAVLAQDGIELNFSHCAGLTGGTGPSRHWR
jgi:hypothetical protein